MGSGKRVISSVDILFGTAWLPKTKAVAKGALIGRVSCNGKGAGVSYATNKTDSSWLADNNMAASSNPPANDES